MLNDTLILKYSKEDNKDGLKNCKKLIKSIVKKHCGRDRFISYRQAYYFACDMDNVLKKQEILKTLCFQLILHYWY